MTTTPDSSHVLIIGSSGFIGSHLSQTLVARGFRVSGLDKKPAAESLGPSQFHLGDILDRDAVRRALVGVDMVVNLAAVHADFGHADSEYWETNETGAKILTDAMAATGVQRVLFTSSMAVYGDRDDEPDETTEPTPSSVYGASKWAAERVFRQWCQADPQRSLVIIRPSVVYGERNVANMLKLIRQVHSGFFFQFGAGRNVKATAYVGNLVAMMVQQLEAMQPGEKLYNYADKPDLEMREIVAIIRESLGKSPRVMQFPLGLGVMMAAPFNVLSRVVGRPFPISMARVKKLARSTRMAAQRVRDAGFQQPVSPPDGIRRMVRHYLDQLPGRSTEKRS